MKSFRGSGAHSQVMPRLFRWCDEAAYTHWKASDEKIADWPEAYERLAHEGKLSRVEHPSADHEAKRFAAPRLQPLVGREINPPKRTAA